MCRRKRARPQAQRKALPDGKRRPPGPASCTKRPCLCPGHNQSSKTRAMVARGASRHAFGSLCAYLLSYSFECSLRLTQVGRQGQAQQTAEVESGSSCARLFAVRLRTCFKHGILFVSG